MINLTRIPYNTILLSTIQFQNSTTGGYPKEDWFPLEPNSCKGSPYMFYELFLATVISGLLIKDPYPHLYFYVLGL